jgi:hypothetical protein
MTMEQNFRLKKVIFGKTEYQAIGYQKWDKCKETSKELSLNFKHVSKAENFFEDK